jgi:NitT/TauT family transport system substrate-binding protein
MSTRLIATVTGVLVLLLGCAAPGSGRQPAVPAAQSAAEAPAAAAQGPSAPSAAPRPVRLAYGFVSAEVIPIWIALEQGIYTKYGLAVEPILLQTSAQIAPAMAAGEVDIALTAGAGVVDIDLAGGDQVLILSQNNMMRFFLHARPDIQNIESLRGKRVAITRLGSGIHLATSIVLQRAGLEAGRDVQLAQAGTVDAALTALVSGGVEAAMLSLPTNLLAERQGFPLLADLKGYRVPYMQGALAVTRSTLETRYALVQDFVRAHLEAMGIAKRDPALATRLLGKYTQTDDQDLLERSYRIWVEDLADPPYPSLEAVQAVLDQRAPEVPAARTANPRDFVDDRILRELEASGFLHRALAGTP